ncbi:hypothetical protein [Mesorhizobium amorphae]|uniref:hypothetical protein n=1 Tax=Mesorhizobium amorphae TaxID=71433 RepID=UPI00118563E0|nr:hypothetical protein [Mesorhizobium amorphae]
MDHRNPASPPDRRETREFDAEAWIGEPDRRTYQEYQEARFKLLLAIVLIVAGGVALGLILALIAGLVLHLFS